MPYQFLKAFAVCLFAMLLIFAYEALHPHIPLLGQFESSHFWTGYKDPLPDSTLSVPDSSEFVEALAEFEFDTIIVENDSSGPTRMIYKKGDTSFFKSEPIALSREDSLALAELDKYTGIHHLNDFFNKMQELRQGKRKRVRIAYFGDSTTEGDMIVSDLRNLLQGIFGGRGVGFVSVAPHGTNFRRSIRHKPSDNWTTVNYFSKNQNAEFSFGLSGDYGSSAGASMNRAHKLSFKPASGSSFDKVYLFHGRGNEGIIPNVLAVLNGADSVSYDLNGQQAVNKLIISEQKSNSVDLAFNFPAAFPIFGLSFESDNGLLVDNLAKRSDSGSHFSRISKEVLSQFHEYLGFDLIILHFGANVLTSNTNYSFYENVMIATVRHFQQAMGDIPVLLVGTSDRVIKAEGTEKTSPAVYGLLKAQKRAAVKTHSPFIDLFKLMGGEGTMLKWAKSGKAAPDYVHFSAKGANEVAKIVFEYLADGYEAYANEKIKTPKPGLMTDALQEHKVKTGQ